MLFSFDLILKMDSVGYFLYVLISCIDSAIKAKLNRGQVCTVSESDTEKSQRISGLCAFGFEWNCICLNDCGL